MHFGVFSPSPGRRFCFDQHSSNECVGQFATGTICAAGQNEVGGNTLITSKAAASFATAFGYAEVRRCCKLRL